MTRATPKTARQTKRRPRGEAQEPPAGKDDGTKAREAYLAAAKAAAEKRATAGTCSKCGQTGLKPEERTVDGPSADVVCLSCATPQLARREVLTALGHDPRERCLANWSSDEAADQRRHFFANHVCGYGPKHNQQLSPEDFYRFAPCGWHWCQEKARIGDSQWKELHRALKILQAKEIDPNGIDPVKLAEEYASSADWRAMWPTFCPLAAFVAGQPTTRKLIDPQLLRQVEAAEHAGAAKSAVPLHNFIACLKARGWAPAVAAALLFLFGLAERDEDLEHLKGRVAATASRPK